MTALLKQKSFLASTPLYEVVNEKIVKGLLTLDELDENQKQQLTRYLSKWNPKTGMVKVQYVKSAKHGWGRVYPRESLGFTSFKKKIRNTILNENYLDYDIKNCHPTILLNICQKHHISCENIQKYVQNRAEIIASVAEQHRKMSRIYLYTSVSTELPRVGAKNI